MSMNNYPTVVLGKIYEHHEFTELLWEKLINEECGKLIAQFGESNYKRPCIGYVLGQIGPYDGDSEILIMDKLHDFLELLEEVYQAIKKQDLPIERQEIKLYLRDNWG